MSDRLARLQARLTETETPALLVTNDDNRRYLTGFRGSAGVVLVTPTVAALLVDSRYTEQAKDEADPRFTVRQLPPGGLRKAIPALQQEFGLSRVTIEGASMSVATFETLKTVAEEHGMSLYPTTGLVEPLRQVKDAEELATMARAIAIADDAIDTVSQQLRPGLTEASIAWAIEKRMREAGAEGMAFEVIVGSGPRSALPHARASDRILEDGDVVVLDLGCVVDGYRSDITRTVCLGEPSEEYLRVWQIVLEAQETAERLIRPGMTGHEADTIARDIIAQAGYGEFFGHSLGHGIGLETHEGPTLRTDSADIVREGMVFSVEPGIYLPGKFGVRIEDLVRVTADGVQVLSAAPKTPRVRRTA